MTAWPCGRGMTSRRKPCSSDSRQSLSRSLLGGRAEGPHCPSPRSPSCTFSLLLCVSEAGGVTEGGRVGPGPEEHPAGTVPSAARMLPLCSLGPGASLTRSFPPQPEIRAMLQPAIVGDGPEHSASPAPSQCPWCVVCPHLCQALGQRSVQEAGERLASARP